MKVRILSWTIVALCLLAAGLHRCVNPAQPGIVPSQEAAYHYRLRLPVMDAESLRVTLSVHESCDTARSFVLPLVYFDNPVDTLAGPLVPEVSVTDRAGTVVRTITRTRTIGPLRSRILTIPAGTSYPVTLSYRPRVNRVESSGENLNLRRVYLDDAAGFLIGAYLFAVPFEERLTDLWRKRRTISLTLDLGEEVTQTGIPSTNSTYHNAYALLFTQMAPGAELLSGGEGGGRAFGLYGLNDYRPSAERLDQATADFALILDSLLPIYEGFEEPGPYPVFFRDNTGGLEGTHSFTCLYPDPEERAVVSMVLAHETIHDAVGIRCGDYDDPWWKEGVTTYLGWATVGRLGMASSERCRRGLITKYDSSATIDRYAPAGEDLRMALFADGHDVAYGKGAQIGMCLDLAVRQATGNGMRLDETIAALCRAYEHEAFNREQLVDHFHGLTGADITPILEQYADRAGVIPREVLDTTFTALEKLGAFGQVRVAKSRRAHTRPPWHHGKL